ncbi:MAG: sugar ABC transporter ATP-binding protein [Lachnospiraceae bacterium]|nr:sugar ABC transporter ATP-binding protein [Lachnospiraceae bacterium]MBQ7601638.1 sugar ABC transporter ATP-binding protein [Lachnospiraceae bacterium]MBR6976945.1 sugar ABC transporter ATP-binding protein [Lachnospiraceae bacterium]
MADQKTILEVLHMDKNFGVTVALNDVSFSLERGHVYGLIGENGSGKSTVSSIIAGMQPATKGEMTYKGEPWKPSSMLEAQEHGIGMIVQEAGTIPNITVAENIFLGHEKMFKMGPFINRRKLTAKAQELLDELGIKEFKASDRTGRLDMQMRKIIEIAKCMYWKPEILIVDETSTALSLEGRQFLYKVMDKQREENKTVMFISHDLDEMMEHCDKLTVLRDGVIIGTLDQSEYEPNRIRKMMVGRELKGDYYRSDYEGYSDEVVLKATDVTTLQDLLCLNLELHKGEILGIGGLSECGMHTVGKALFGIEKVLDGDVKLANGTVVKSPRVAIDNKMAYVSKNRDTESLGLSGTIAENIASTGYKINSFFLNLISFKKEKKYVDRQIEELQIKCAGKNYMVNTLSGGNKQKVVFGKWVASDAEVLILDCPTRGIDVGVKASMYKLFTEMKKAGKAILLISEELQELIGMCDRILIMKDGQVTREVMRAENPTESSLIDYMI